IMSAIRAGIRRLVLGLRSGVAVITGLGFALVIAAYTAVGVDRYEQSVLDAFFASRRKRAEAVLKKCAKNLRKLFKAQLIDMGIIGLITSVSLYLVGVKYWAVYGLLTVVFGLVPYIGIFAVVAIAS